MASKGVGMAALGVSILGLLLLANRKRQTTIVNFAPIGPLNPPTPDINIPRGLTITPQQPTLTPEQQYEQDRTAVIQKHATMKNGHMVMSVQPDMVLKGLTVDDLRAMKPKHGTVAAGIIEAYDEAPGAPGVLLRDYGLTENGREQSGVWYLPRFLLPLDASLSVHDQNSIIPSGKSAAADQFGRSQPPGSPPAGLSWEGFTELTSATYGMLKDALASSKGFVKGITDNPLWKLAQTGVAFVPGIGTAVSVGMSAAYAYGHNMSLEDAALKAARDAVPGGAAGQAAFDVAVGVAQGQDLSDAAISAARNQIPEGEARDAFDEGIKVAKGKDISADLKAKAEAAGKAQAEKALGGLFK